MTWLSRCLHLRRVSVNAWNRGVARDSRCIEDQRLLRRGRHEALKVYAKRVGQRAYVKADVLRLQSLNCPVSPRGIVSERRTAWSGGIARIDGRPASAVRT